MVGMADEQIGRRGPMAFLVNRSVMEERDSSHPGLMRWDGVCVGGVLLRDTSNLPAMHWQ